MCATKRTVGINEPPQGSSFAGSAKEPERKWGQVFLFALEHFALAFTVPRHVLLQDLTLSPPATLCLMRPLRS